MDFAAVDGGVVASPAVLVELWQRLGAGRAGTEHRVANEAKPATPPAAAVAARRVAEVERQERTVKR